MPRPDHTPELLDLLVEWEDRRAAGEQVSVETLCADRPQFAADVRAGIAHLAAVDRVLEGDTAEIEGVPVLRGFEVRGWLGGGGMGDVYLARDLSLACDVAVKIPKPSSRHAARERFRREGQTLAQLRHPGIVPVFAAGVTDAGVPYLVMQHIPGGTLADRLRDGPLPPAEAARAGARVARAVHHAHRHRVIHRDLKPSNIFFAEDGSPLVGDFGVAAVLAGESAAGDATDSPPAHPHLTAAGTVVGTPAYCAPELFRGERASPATDIWALGVVLYQAVTGELPFDAADEAGLKRAIEAGAYRPPHEWNPAVPADLAAVIGRCLSADPAKRFASAEALADALDRRVAGRRARWVGGGRIAASLAAAAAGLALRPSEGRERAGEGPQPAASAIPAATEADSRAVEALRVATAMREQGTVRLRPQAAASLVNPNAVTVTAAKDGGTTLDAQGIAFVQLSEIAHARNYEFRARLRQLRGLGLPLAGLYFGHAAHPGGAHEVALLQFTDFGLTARQKAGPNGDPGNDAVLAHLWYRPPDLAAPNPAVTERVLPWTSLDLRLWHPQSRNPWAVAPTHDLVVRVEADADWVQLTFDGRTAGMPFSKLKRHLGLVNGKPPAVTTGGGLGVFVQSCSVTVSDCTLTAVKRNP